MRSIERGLLVVVALVAVNALRDVLRVASPAPAALGLADLVSTTPFLVSGAVLVRAAARRLRVAR